MKKLIFLIFSIFVILFNLIGCNNEGGSDLDTSTKVSMTAKILEINDNILVEVIKSEYAFGNYLLIVNESTIYLDEKENKIIKPNLKVGDIIEVKYSGQVMLSIPPKVVAHIIKLQ